MDNHDVERIHTKLTNKAHFAPVHILLYTLPGIPSIYYGSEFAIEGRKEQFSDASLRPALNLADYADAVEKNPCTALIAALGKIRQQTLALSYGSYTELQLTNRQYAFARNLDGVSVIVTVNNDDNDASMNVPAGNTSEYIGTLTGNHVKVQDGRINVTVRGNFGEIWVPVNAAAEYEPVKVQTEEEKPGYQAAVETTEVTPDSDTAQEDVETACTCETVEVQPENTPSEKNNTENFQEVPKEPVKTVSNKSPEEMTVEELQAAILGKMANNGPVTDQMRKTVADNIWHDSLVNWLKSFR